MVVPGGTVGGGVRVAGGLLALGGVLTVVATFLPIYRFGAALTPESAPYETTIGAWVTTSGMKGKETSSPTWTTGMWLVLVALVAVAAAVALFATARRPASRARPLAAFGAGILAAATAAQCLPAVTGLVFASARSIDYHFEAGWILLVLAAISAAAGGIVASMTGPRAALPGRWAPGPPPPPQWGPPPGPAPWPQHTGPFPAQYPPPGPPRV